MTTAHSYQGNGLWYVGHTEQVIAGRVRRVCACCGLTLENCRCEHTSSCWCETCPYRFDWLAATA